MPATTPEQVHRVFEDSFNVGAARGDLCRWQPLSVDSQSAISAAAASGS
jgi:hypothetical protein